MKFLAFALLGLFVLFTVTACGGLSFAVANAPAFFGEFDRRADVAYLPGPRRTLDVYTPRNVVRAPIIVFWYGGSWQSGSKNLYRFVGAELAKEGYVAVLPDYRVYPEVRFPAFIDDAAAAVAWVRAHAEEIGGDPQRIFLAGHSAGAHIAAMLAYDDARLAQAGVPAGTVRGFIGLSGPYALDPDDDTLRTIFGAPYVHADWQPVRFVKPGAPPALLVHGEADTVVLPEHTRKMAQALEAAGVPVTLRLFPERKHRDPVAAFAKLAPNKLPMAAEFRAFVDATK